MSQTLNEKKIETRIISRNDTLENWNDSTLILKKGEIALAYIEKEEVNTDANGNKVTTVVPTYLMKIGDDVHSFKDLKWLAAPASDVYAWAKNPDVDDALDDSQIIEAIQGILNGLGDDAGYETVLDAIATEIGKFESEYSDADATGIITEINVQDDGITVERRKVNNTDIEDGTISQAKITNLTKDLEEIDTRIEAVEGMLSDTGKVMEFIGGIDTFDNLINETKSDKKFYTHDLQKGDVVVITSTSEEYILLTTTTNIIDDKTNYPGYVFNSIIDDVTYYFYWEEFGHASATDKALEELKDEVDKFYNRVFHDKLENPTEEQKGATIQGILDRHQNFLESLENAIGAIKVDLNDNFPKLEEDGDKNYLTFYSGKETPNETDTQYLIFDCGTSAARPKLGE